jgi:hypothetical protein
MYKINFVNVDFDGCIKKNSNKKNAYLFLLSHHDQFVWKRSLVCILEPWLIIGNYKFHKCTYNIYLINSKILKS